MTSLTPLKLKSVLRAGRLLALVLAVLFVGSGPAEASISIEQSVDRTDMAFEDTATFTVSVTWDGPAHAYLFEKPIRLRSDQLKVARFSSTVSTIGQAPEDKTTKLFRFKLAPVLSGTATIEAATVEYLAWPDSTSGMMSTDPLAIQVAEPRPSVAKEEGGLSGGMVALIIVLVLGGGVGVVTAFKKKPAPVKAKTPVERFLDDLKDVKAEAGSDLKNFQTGFYRILAVYIASRYDFPTAGLNAEAIVARLDAAEPVESTRVQLSEWLRRAEKEKYTPLPIQPGEVLRLESDVRAFFEKMR